MKRERDHVQISPESTQVSGGAPSLRAPEVAATKAAVSLQQHIGRRVTAEQLVGEWVLVNASGPGMSAYLEKLGVSREMRDKLVQANTQFIRMEEPASCVRWAYEPWLLAKHSC